MSYISMTNKEKEQKNTLGFIIYIQKYNCVLKNKNKKVKKRNEIKQNDLMSKNH